MLWNIVKAVQNIFKAVQEFFNNSLVGSSPCQCPSSSSPSSSSSSSSLSSSSSSSSSSSLSPSSASSIGQGSNNGPSYRPDPTFDTVIWQIVLCSRSEQGGLISSGFGQNIHRFVWPQRPLYHQPHRPLSPRWHLASGATHETDDCKNLPRPSYPPSVTRRTPRCPTMTQLHLHLRVRPDRRRQVQLPTRGMGSTHAGTLPLGSV